ncbi:unnamed protein product [Cuscuta campestris]|uniref:Reverse transcriptase domain-containing protein n=1 Tax=Cuscuta campestris TaxID=132261 RepID=A0A484M2X7_9ASTE|nr:unnamed protein product [Cuscuta campestris]
MSVNQALPKRNDLSLRLSFPEMPHRPAYPTVDRNEVHLIDAASRMRFDEWQHSRLLHESVCLAQDTLTNYGYAEEMVELLEGTRCQHLLQMREESSLPLTIKFLCSIPALPEIESRQMTHTLGEMVYKPMYGAEHIVSNNYYKYFEMNHVVEAFIILPGGVDTLEGFYNGIPSVSFNEEEEKILENKLLHSAVGRFQQEVDLSTIKQWLLKLGFNWFKLRRINTRDILFIFKEEEDYLRLMQKSIWYVQNIHFHVLKWTRDYDSIEESPIYPVWVSLDHLPLHLIDFQALFSIASLLGRPVTMDNYIVNRDRRDGARFCVEMDISIPPPPKIHFRIGGKDKFIKCNYEDLPSYCSHCKKFGHKCSPNPVSKPTGTVPSGKGKRGILHEEQMSWETTKGKRTKGRQGFTAGHGTQKDYGPKKFEWKLKASKSFFSANLIDLLDSYKEDTSKIVATPSAPQQSLLTLPTAAREKDNNINQFPSLSEAKAYADKTKANHFRSFSSPKKGAHRDFNRSLEACIFPLTPESGSAMLSAESISPKLNGNHKTDGHSGSHSDSGSLKNISDRNTMKNFQIVIPSPNATSLQISRKKIIRIRSNGKVLRRLDRVLVNNLTMDDFEDIYAKHLSKATSDHNPILLSCIKTDKGGPKPFRFINAWGNHHSLQHMITKVWNTGFHHGGMLGLSNKLKSLKVQLKEWNISCFGNIFLNLKKAEEAAVQAQQAYEQDPSEKNREEDNKARAKLILACDNEKDVISATQEFFLGIPIPKSYGATFISLIPKKDIPKDLGDYRPISLSTFMSKISTRNLADRLQRILPKIISPEQAGFQRGKGIEEQILLVEEFVHKMDYQTRGGNTILKLDMAKGFDYLEWEYLQGILHNFGFTDQAQHLLMANLKATHFSVMINGSPKGFFKMARGVKQGDPLSPLLFIIAGEGLSRMIKHLMHTNYLQRFNTGRDLLISHLAYADDIIIFCNGSLGNMTRIKEVLQIFMAASGQEINLNKSRFYCGKGVKHDSIPKIEDRLGMKHGALPFKYLGAPICKGKLKRRDCGMVTEHFRKYIESWYRKTLNPMGRLILIKHVLSSIPLHLIAVHILLKSVINTLHSMMSTYLWGVDNNKLRYH